MAMNKATNEMAKKIRPRCPENLSILLLSP